MSVLGGWVGGRWIQIGRCIYVHQYMCFRIAMHLQETKEGNCYRFGHFCLLISNATWMTAQNLAGVFTLLRYCCSCCSFLFLLITIEDHTRLFAVGAAFQHGAALPIMDVQTFLRECLIAFTAENTDPAKWRGQQFNSIHRRHKWTKKTDVNQYLSHTWRRKRCNIIR